MKLSEVKEKIECIEPKLSESPFVVAHTFERNNRRLHVAITSRLKRNAQRGKIWKSKTFLAAFKNAKYGFDPNKAQSPGGYDGIFLLTRNHTPKNKMMKKIFDRFLDKKSSGALEIAGQLNSKLDELICVRLVSHHMRLLGVLKRGEKEDWLVLVDYDNSE